MSRKSVTSPSPPVPVELVEVVDRHDRVLGVMSLDEVHRQSLFHRAVLVVLFNPENKIYLQKRARSKALYPGRWDLSVTGHVQRGESRVEAALRETEEELGLRVERLVERREMPAGPLTGFEFLTLFSVGPVREPPRPNPEELEGGMFVDREEFLFLQSHYRDMLTPALVYCGENELLFPSMTNP